MLYKKIIRPILFNFDPEKIHELALKGISNPIGKHFFKNITYFESKHLSKNIWGIDFPNPIGLAAGFDKNAAHVDGFAALGFGFIEIGTITPKAQPGNPRPRLFRLPVDSAIINRMGFNNDGVKAAIDQLKKRKAKIVIGGNIGKNKITSNDSAVNDYLSCFIELYNYVDYFVVNVSSPNTPGLRALQMKEPLLNILGELQNAKHSKSKNKPILLKIAPDLDNSQLDDILEIVERSKTDGIVATNTTIKREKLHSDQAIIEKIGDGGLSGNPVFEASNNVLRYIKKHLDIPVIGVGGISSPQAALEKLKAGADLVQVYTGLIYEGPLLIKRIKKYLDQN